MSSRASEQESRPFVDSRDYFTDDKKEIPTPYRQEPIFGGSYVEDDADLMHASRNCRPNAPCCSDGIKGGVVAPGFQIQPQNPQYPQHPPNPAYSHQLQEGQQSSQSIAPHQPPYGAYRPAPNYTANPGDVNGKLRNDAYYSPQGMQATGQQPAYPTPSFHYPWPVAATCPPSLTAGQYIVTNQPQGPGGQPHAIIIQPILENPPDDYMGYSVFAALCCCWVVGFMAVARSRECRTAILNGDRELAEEKSRSARNTANAAVGLGILTVIVAGVVIGIRVASVVK